MLQEVFEKLQALQDVLEQIYKIERELEEIPKAILTEKELLTRLKKQFVEKSGNLEKRQLKVKELKSQLHDAEDKRSSYEKQMDVIKTQKENELLDKAIKESILEEQQLRKDLVKEEKETEELNQDVDKMQALVSSQEESIRKEEEKIQSESDAKKKELKALNAKKDKITPGIDEEVLFKFERIIRSRGKGIVPVDILKEKDNEIKAFICSECHMVLPIQFVNDVHSQDSLMFCPYCSRILYYDESIDDQNMIYNSDDDLIGGFAGLDEEEEEEEDYDEAEDERASDSDESHLTGTLDYTGQVFPEVYYADASTPVALSDTGFVVFKNKIWYQLVSLLLVTNVINNQSCFVFITFDVFALIFIRDMLYLQRI